MPARARTFFYRMDVSTFYAAYWRWFRRLSERVGIENTVLVWKNAFADYDDAHLRAILAAEWRLVESNTSRKVAGKVSAVGHETFSATAAGLSESDVRRMIEQTPPILQIKRAFSTNTVGAEISAYDALHLQFDGLAYLAEAIIEAYGKQGELVIYDLMVAERLASSQGAQGSAEQFIAEFTAQPDKPTLFTAGLDIETIHKTSTEIVFHVRTCEWARYFRERHPKVGYLMACSTDEVAYKSYHAHLRLQRTQTLMEGAEKCDFRIYTVHESA